jgi:hypothetical protein
MRFQTSESWSKLTKPRERGSTARQRMSGKFCWECKHSLEPDPNNQGERLCAKCTEARQPLRDTFLLPPMVSAPLNTHLITVGFLLEHYEID